MVARLIRPDQPIEVKNLCVIEYGQPGSKKTSLLQTAKNPITFASDKGIYRAFRRKDCVMFDTWEDIVGFDCSGYDTIGIDTGAKAMEYLRQDRGVIDYIAAFHARGGVIASICHAAQLLISARLVKGRLVSGYYSIRDDIENAGGTFVDGVCTFDRIVSAPHYRFNGKWMAAALQAVATETALRNAA